MGRAFWSAFGLAALAALLGGCAGLRVGAHKQGVVVEAAGTAPSGERAVAVAAAEREAVDGVIDLFVSSRTRAASAAVLEERVLSCPRAYIKRFDVKGISPAPGASSGTMVRVLALVLLERLAKDLDGLGLVRPEGVYGTPKILVSIKETGIGGGFGVGLASDMLRRQLSARGYEAQDFSDRLNPRYQKTGSAQEALAAAKAAGADIVLSGSAWAEPVSDERLAGYHSWRGRVAASAAAVPSGESLATVAVEATAVDMTSRGAAAKALENAGDLAAERLSASLSGRFRERSEISLRALGLEGLERARRFVADLRGLPGVAGAAVVALGRRESRLRVFVEKLSADDLAALLLRLPGYSFTIRAVEPDFHYVEVEVPAEV